MSVSTIIMALSLAATPVGSPSRLDPNDIEALEALLRAMDAQAEEQSGGEAAEDEATSEEIAEDAVEPVQTDEPAPDSAVDAVSTADEPASEDAEPGEADRPEAADANDAGDTGATREIMLEADESQTREEAQAEPVQAEIDRGAMAGSAGQAPRRMGPHVGMDHYASLRGASWGEGVQLDWQIAVSPLGEDGAPAADSAPEDGARAQSRTFFSGSGWAGEIDDGNVWLYDFSARRLLTLDRENAHYANASIYADVRRNVDIYAALSQSGQAEEIAFGPSSSFHRFWLEAAMGVAAAPAGLTRTTRPAQSVGDEEPDGTVTSWYRQEDGPRVASVWTGCGGAEMTDEQRANLITAFAHRVPIHPDILAALNEGNDAVCGLAFTVVSPESPDGRVEHWTLAEVSALDADTLGFADASLHTGNSALIDDDAHEAVMAALAGDTGPAPEPADFMLEIQSLREEGDFAGAMLTQVQEVAHFGVCPSETVGSERLACAGASALADAASEDEGYAAVVEATEAAAEGSHRLAINRLLPYLDRRDHAGAAARTIIARQLVEWGQEGLAAHEDLDPAGLLAEALEIDPFAVNIYWYLSLRYMAAGAPEEAWFFLDTGRALPGREPTETLAQAAGLERRLGQLAPALFPADAAQ